MALVRRKKKKNRKFLKILVVVLLLGSAYFFVNRNFANSEIVIPTKTISGTSSEWWDNDYSFRRRIELTSSSEGGIEINHAQMNIDGKSNMDGSDIKIIGTSDNKFIEIPYKFNQFDSITTRITFNPSDFNSKEYYIYYGNYGVKDMINSSGTKSIINSIKSLFVLKDEEKPDIRITSSKKWLLKDSEEISKVNIKVDSKFNLNSSNLFYTVDNESKSNELKLNNETIEVNLNSLKTGDHKFFVFSNIDGKITRSNSVTFKVSEPVYVAWTLDWEGVDPKQEYLDTVADIASDYNIKITHFFNPRILINSKIDMNRKKQLVAWVMNRHDKFGEEIAMHLHMHHDMVEEAGVKAKYTAKTWDKGNSGFDTPSTEYTYDEYLKILKWGRNKMEEWKMPEPKGFRAGGWFANEDTLRAMQDAGFQYDSSARISQPIGQNKLIQAWEMTSKTQPYKISKLDQNSSIAPNLDLIEMPNNGLDSYWSEAKDMKQNFYDNYAPGTTIDKERIVTFLSHPEWFYVDEPKLREVYSEISKYRIDLDNGPVKFVTLSEWIDTEWDK